MPKSSSKFVLVAMANLAGSDMTCWPSMQYLINATSLDRKTVLECIKRLRDSGFLIDTGERKGTTGRVVVYRLNSPEIGTVAEAQTATQGPEKLSTNGPKNGMVPNLEMVPNFPPNGPVFPTQSSRFSVEMVPKTGHRTTKEPPRNPKEPSGKPTTAPGLLDDIEPQVVADYLQVRKAKKAGPLTATAVAGLRREAAKAGITCTDAMKACCEFGWQGFNATWYAQRVGASASTPTKTAGKHAGFQTLNYREGVSEDGTFV